MTICGSQCFILRSFFSQNVMNPIFSHYRYGLSFKTLTGESKFVADEMTATWKDQYLPIIFSGYPLKDIFNADEFGLFYQTLSRKTMHSKGHKCSNGKHCKASLTGLAAVNAFGERLPMFVIGKSHNPKCFKGVKHLPCWYKSLLKSWMSSELFEEWVRELDQNFGVEKRKIALIIVTVKLEMSWMGGDDISSTKHRLSYAANGPRDHSRFKGKILATGGVTIDIMLEKKASLTAIFILSAMTWLSKAWMTLPDKTFTITVKTLATDLNFLRTKYSDQVDTNFAIDEYIDFDHELSTNHIVLTDKNIIHKVLRNFADVSSDEDDMDVSEVESITKPLIEEVKRAIEILEEFSFYSEFGDRIMKSVREVNHYINRKEQKTKKVVC